MKIPLYKLRPRSLRHQMALLLGVMAFCMIGFMAFSLLSYYKLQYQTLKTAQTEKITQVLHEIDYNYTYFSKLSTSLAYNELVQDYLIEKDKESKFDLVQSVSNLLINTQNQEPSIIDIAVVGFHGNSINVAGDFSIPENLISELPDGYNSIYFFGKQNYYIYSMNTDCIIAARWIYPLDLKNAEPCGAVFLALEPSHFLGNSYELDATTNSQKMMFIDSEENLILGDQELYKVYKQNTLDSSNLTLGNSIYTSDVYDIPHIGYKLISYIPKGDLIYRLIKTVGSQYFLIMIIFIFICGFLAIFVSRFFNMITNLTGIMQKITSGNRRALKERIDLDQNPSNCLEAQMIGTAFNHMLDEIDNLNHDIFSTCTKMYETKIYAKKTELAFLRSQINPHFLYNTLALICGMSTEGHSEDIINICQALAQILRYSIKGNEFVTFSQEFEIIKSYLMIQSTRFEGRFTIEYNITDEILNARIPKMILQPLVENSIVHGLENKLEMGHLQIGALRDPSNNTLVLWVYDTGLGMNEKKLEEIRQSLIFSGIDTILSSHASKDEITPKEENDSLGLTNVNSRIRLYYGEEYHLNVDSEENIGTNIQIRIPFENL